jgi:Ran GTPase-activating protein (RanGAP) involved in mRNA processing and transport
MDITRELTELGKFNKIKPNDLNRIIIFLPRRDIICVLTNINKKFKTTIESLLKKDNSTEQCLKEMKTIIKSIEEYKFITNNHCITLDENLKKFKEQYNPFAYEKSVQVLSFALFKDVNSLDIQKNNIGVDGLLLLGPLLLSSKTLNNLNLSYNNLADEGCKFLADFLKINNSIVTLSLDCNAISDSGIIVLSECIASHKNLKTVKFVLNHITIEGVKYLVTILEKFVNSTINVIDMKYNNIVITDENSLEHFKKLKICF